MKNYWIERVPKSDMAYRLSCPKCHKTFIMPKAWGVWKGCPVCWTELEYKSNKKELTKVRKTTKETEPLERIADALEKIAEKQQQPLQNIKIGEHGILYDFTSSDTNLK